MTQILEYIVQNYTWFLGGTILILLAIIGYYADKTNFGQNKIRDDKSEKEAFTQNNLEEENNLFEEKESISDDNLDLETKNVESIDSNYDPMTGEPVEREEILKNEDLSSDKEEKIIVEIKNEPIDKSIQDSAEMVDTEKKSVQNKIGELLADNNITKKEVVIEENLSTVLNEEEVEKFNDEFNSILPQKELINDDLLSDIDDLELGKTQKIDLGEIPHLDDIELPKIKKMVEEETDVWKF